MESKAKINDELLVAIVNDILSVKESVTNLSTCMNGFLRAGGWRNDVFHDSNIDMDTFEPSQGAIQSMFPSPIHDFPSSTHDCKNNVSVNSNTMEIFAPIQGAIQSMFPSSINDCSSSDPLEDDRNVTCNGNPIKLSNTLCSNSDIDEAFIRTPLSQTNYVDHIETIIGAEHENSVAMFCELPYLELKVDAFQYFNASALENCTQFTHFFSNRSTAYYGDHPYHYGNTTHVPQNFDKNPYLQKLLSYVEIVYPNLKFNSALINLYNSGHDFIPHHSDDEEDIVDDSVILTISLGCTRTIEFRDKSTSLIAESVALPHGSSFTMTQLSQKYFTHSITPEADCSEKRLSVTLRLLQPSGHSTPAPGTGTDNKLASCDSLASLLDALYSDDESEPDEFDSYDQSYGGTSKTECPIMNQPSSQNISTKHKLPESTVNDEDIEPTQDGYQSIHNGPISKNDTWSNHHSSKYGRNSVQPQSPASDSNVDTIYISSSMFRHLDPKGLSSKSQQAKVFFYPGANSAQMLQRLLKDPQYKALRKEKIKRVILLTGTNYVDSLFSDASNFQSAVKDINDLVFHLWSTCFDAKLCVMNILPRSNGVKNRIISDLNDEINNMCSKHGLLFGALGTQRQKISCSLMIKEKGRNNILWEESTMFI